MPEPPRSRYLEFVYLDLFEQTSAGILGEEEMRAVEDEILRNPEKGTIQAGTGGVRKIRAATGAGGKRGGARVVYLYVQVREKVYFILAFPKNVQPSLTDEQKKGIRALVAKLKQEGGA